MRPLALPPAAMAIFVGAGCGKAAVRAEPPDPAVGGSDPVMGGGMRRPVSRGRFLLRRGGAPLAAGSGAPPDAACRRGVAPPLAGRAPAAPGAGRRPRRVAPPGPSAPPAPAPSRSRRAGLAPAQLFMPGRRGSSSRVAMCPCPRGLWLVADTLQRHGHHPPARPRAQGSSAPAPSSRSAHRRPVRGTLTTCAPGAYCRARKPPTHPRAGYACSTRSHRQPSSPPRRPRRCAGPRPCRRRPRATRALAPPAARAVAAVPVATGAAHPDALRHRNPRHPLRHRRRDPASGLPLPDVAISSVIDIGGRLGQAGAELRASIGGAVQHAVRHLPVAFRNGQIRRHKLLPLTPPPLSPAGAVGLSVERAAASVSAGGYLSSQFQNMLQLAFAKDLDLNVNEYVV
ncbi:hypothetical protein U9M48_005519 [Paspalum notatum var. saurae]|uniref:Uncharacterized protein n=1 Tax=Paspalum notatum var. saurae TaxID=547442 RepID=A0AAQ3PQB8_PASNO